MSLMQRFRSVRKSRAKSEIYEISSRGEPLFVTQPRQSSFMHFDKVQNSKAKDNENEARGSEEIEPVHSSEKPLPDVPTPAIPARNPRRGERSHGPAASTESVSDSSPSSTQAATDPPALIISSDDTTTPSDVDSIFHALPSNAAALDKLSGALVLRNSLLSFNDLFSDETVGDVDQLLNAIAKVQTSFAESQEDWREVSVFPEDDEDEDFDIAAVNELYHSQRDAHALQLEEDPVVSSNQSVDEVDDHLDEDSFAAAQMKEEPVRVDLIIEDVSDISDDLSSHGPSVLEMDISNTFNGEQQRKPTNSLDLDYLLGNAHEDMTIHLMLDTNVAPNQDISAARTRSHSDPSGTASAGDDSGSSYSIDEYYDSPRAMSDEVERRNKAVGTETPRTHYSELIADSPYADKLATRGEEEHNDDKDSRAGDWENSPVVEEVYSKLTTDLPGSLLFMPLEILSPTTYQIPSPIPKVEEQQHGDEEQETEEPHHRVLSWLSTQPLPSNFAHSDPASPNDSTGAHTSAAGDVHAMTSTSAARDSTVPQSFLRKSEEQERFALEAQLEIEDWLTEWTSSLQVSRLYHRALGGMA